MTDPSPSLLLEALTLTPLRRLQLALGPGMHALLGTPADGTDVVVELVSGAVAPKRGRCLVHGRAPHTDPAARSRVAAVAAHDRHPPAWTVERHVKYALAARDDRRSATDVLAEYELASYARRRYSRLDAAERRAVALALALSHPDPLVIAAFEPLATIGGLPRELVVERLRARAERCVVLVCTSRATDAADLGAQVQLLYKGCLARKPGAATSRALAPGLRREVIVHGDGLRDFAARILDSDAISAARWERAPVGERVVIQSSDQHSSCRAIAKAAAETDANIRSLWTSPVGVDQAHQATLGLARGAFDAAHAAALDFHSGKLS